MKFWAKELADSCKNISWPCNIFNNECFESIIQYNDYSGFRIFYSDVFARLGKKDEIAFRSNLSRFCHIS